jgi:hypothetical protein
VLFGGNDHDIIRSYLHDDKDFGGDGDDAVYSGAGNDYVNGNQGFDQIYGGVGIDDLRGGRDGDAIYGGNSRGDWLRGDLGDDELWGTGQLEGGEGDDRLLQGFYDAPTGQGLLYGGNGDDSFGFEGGSAYAEGGAGADSYSLSDICQEGGEWLGWLPDWLVITDFERGEDVLYLQMLDGHNDLISGFGDDGDGIYGEGDRGATVTDDGLIIDLAAAWGVDYPHTTLVYLEGVPELEVGHDLIIL